MNRGVLVRGVAAVAVAAALVGGTARPAAADEVTVVAGVDGFYDPGEHVVVRVTVSADRLLRGEVRVGAPNAGRTIVVRRPVEVPGGAVKTYLLPVPTSPFDSGALTVDLVPDDGQPTRRTVDLQAATDTDLVGVLPQLAAAAGQLPGTAPLTVDAGTARLSVLEPDTLALGADAIASYDVIAGLTSDLDQLDTTALDALLDWIGHGGRLLLDDDAEPTALPEAWRPGPAGYAFAGIGEIRRTGGAATRGAWNTILDPGAGGPSTQDPSVVRAALEGQIPPSATLARASGLEVPGIGLAVGIILVYVAVVGPLLYAVLRLRRRLTMAWIAVPVISLVTAGVVVVTGNRMRTSIQPLAAGVIETWPNGGRALVNLLVTSRDGGEAGADLPPGWTLLRGEDFGSGRMIHEFDDDGSTALADLDPGQATMLSVSGPARLPGGSSGLVITAESDRDGEVTGTVRNDLALRVTDVAVFVGNSAVMVGDLGPGEEAPWTARGTDRFELAPLFPQVWGDADFGFGVGFRGGAAAVSESGNVDLGTWGLWAAQRRSALRQSGLARAVGWTDELAQPVETDSGRPLAGRLAVTSVVPVTATGAHLTDATVRASLVRAPSVLGGPVDAEWIVVRYVLPPIVGGQPAPVPETLGLMVPRWAAEVETWAGGAWLPLTAGQQPAPAGDQGAGPSAGQDAAPPAGQDTDRFVWLPPDAVRDGVVHVRLRVRFDREFVGTDLVLRTQPPEAT